MLWDIKTSTVFEVEAESEFSAFEKAQRAMRDWYSLNPGKMKKEWACEVLMPHLFPERDRMSLETELIHMHAMIRQAAAATLTEVPPERMEESILAQIGVWFDKSASDASKAFQVRADRASLAALKEIQGGKIQ